MKDRFKVVPAVYLVLLRNNKILLSRRHGTGYCDGEYSLPAGHLDGNETLLQTMVREAEEEIGIMVKPDDLRLVHVMHRKAEEKYRRYPEEERIDFFFITDKWAGEPKIMELHKCDDLRWFDLGSLPDNVIPYIRQMIDCVRKKILYSESGW